MRSNGKRAWANGQHRIVLDSEPQEANGAAPCCDPPTAVSTPLLHGNHAILSMVHVLPFTGSLGCNPKSAKGDLLPSRSGWVRVPILGACLFTSHARPAPVDGPRRPGCPLTLQ